MGLDVKRFLDAGAADAARLRPRCTTAENPGVQLGIALGVAATRFGRDKVTIIALARNRRPRRLACAASS